MYHEIEGSFTLSETWYFYHLVRLFGFEPKTLEV